MRLTSLALTCYGHFEALTLALDPRPGCLNVVVAPNGAGKSVLRQAITELLFGIHPQTPMDFAFGYPRMRLQAEAVQSEAAFGFVRRKRMNNSLTDLEGNPASPALLARLPRADDRKRLERLLLLDSTQLRGGGAALMASGGDLADALLSGAGELGSARALVAGFRAKRDDTAPVRRADRTPFHAASDAWNAAGTRLADSLVRPLAIRKLETERTAAADAQKAAKAEAASQAATLRELERIRRTRDILGELDGAEAWLAANTDAPVLPPGADATLAAAIAAGAEAARALDEARQAAASLQDVLDAIAVDGAVLAEAAAIEALAREMGVANRSSLDMPGVAAELAASRLELSSLLGRLGLPPAPEAAAGAVRPDALLAEARELVLQAGLAEAAVTRARETVAKLREAITEAQDELQTLPEITAADGLKALLTEVTAEGDPARQVELARDATATAQAHRDAALARVPGRPGDAASLDAASLIAMAVPADPTLARLDETMQEARARQAQADATAKTATERRASTQSHLARLTGDRPLPDAAAVAEARARRDRGWDLVALRLAGAPATEAEAAYGPGGSLASVYVAAVAAADRLADRRAEETERLARAAQLLLELEDATAAQRVAESSAGEATRAEAVAQAGWGEAMARLGLPQQSRAAEARAFLMARDAVVQAEEGVRRAEASQARLLARQAEWAGRLAATLGQPERTLPQAVAEARQLAEAAERGQANRGALEKALRRDRSRLTVAETALTAAQDAQDAWSRAWRDVLARLGRSASEPPAAVAAVLDALVRLRGEALTAGRCEDRLARMQSQLDRFAATARAIATRLGLADAAPMALAAELERALLAAKQQQTKRETLAPRAKDASALVHARSVAQRRAAQALDEAVAATGAADVAHAQDRVLAAAERLKHAAARSHALRLLAQQGDGRPVAELRTQAEATPPDSVLAQSQAAEAAIADANQRAETAAVEVAQIDSEIARLATKDEAGLAARDRAAAAARLAHVLDDALVQHTAAVLLEHALASVEAQGGDNARLGRIGGTFAALTGGAYTRVVPAEEGKPSAEHGRLAAIERGGVEKHIAELSEGTRDQLYLALRLVAIEDYAATAPPLPFIADDILQSFDDTRALAALQALLGLSRHAQVIILTHHPHVAELARTLPPGQVHFATL